MDNNHKKNNNSTEKDLNKDLNSILDVYNCQVFKIKRQ